MIDKEKVKKHFSRGAKNYDINAHLHRRIIDDLLGFLPNTKPLNIADLGCGTGLLTAEIKKKYPRARIVGVDLAPGMIEVAKTKVLGTEFVEFDVEDLPFEHSSFDLLVSSSSFQWMDTEKVIKEAGRVLKPGGQLVFSTFGEGTLKELEALGFRIHKLPSLEEWRKQLSKRFSKVELENRTFKEFFQSAKQLTDFLKTIGARGAFGGEVIRPVDRLKFLSLRQNSGFIATFNAIYGRAFKYKS
ncbi:MAG: methyltransferase domain-containing protein [Candidatus Margulisiibacteriota bacterium]